jgi:D-serine dehydratase
VKNEYFCYLCFEKCFIKKKELLEHEEYFFKSKDLKKLKMHKKFGFWEEDLKLLKSLANSEKNIKEQKNRYKRLLDLFDFYEEESDEELMEAPVNSIQTMDTQEEEEEIQEKQINLNKYTKSKVPIAGPDLPIPEEFLVMNQREEFIKNEFLKKYFKIKI